MSETIHIQEDGKKRKATVAELEQFEKDRAEFEAEQKRIEAETAAKAQAKQSAMNTLKALGLTDSEVEGLING